MASLPALLGLARADERGLDGPGAAPPPAIAAPDPDPRADDPPRLAIEFDALDAAVARAAELAAPPAAVALSPAPEATATPPDFLFSPGASGPASDPLMVAALSPRGAPPPFALPRPPEPPAALTASAPPPPRSVVVAIAPAMLRMALDARLADPALRPRAFAAQRKLREEIAQAYAARGDAPVWIADGAWTPAARGAFDRLDHAAEDGLDLGAARLAALGPPTLDAELRLTDAVVAYAKQAASGRVEPSRIAALISARPPQIEAAAALSRVGGAASEAEASQALRDFNPPHRGYVALRDKLAETRRERRAEAPPPIPAGPTLKVGMRDARVALIRERLGLEPVVASDAAPLYDAELAAAVTAFQRGAGLTASGRLTPQTAAALSGDDAARIENEIVANMERWRWLPRDLGREHVEVNIPDFALALKEDERTTLTARVVVGKPDSPTPIFSDRMRFVVVNPSWTMPPSILENEALPNLAADPNYYTRRGYEVIWRRGKVAVRQPPGERNALGHVKFMFPNDHAVYLHDTPQRGLFAQARRAYSHGCVRVDQPFRLAEAVLNKRYSEAELKKMVGPRERTLNLDEPLPIHLTYFTAKVEEDGRLTLSDDVYGYSRRLRAAMGLDGAIAALAPPDLGARLTSGVSSEATERAAARKARAKARAAQRAAATFETSEPVFESRPARPSSFVGWFSQRAAAREPSLSGR